MITADCHIQEIACAMGYDIGIENQLDIKEQ